MITKKHSPGVSEKFGSHQRKNSVGTGSELPFLCYTNNAGRNEINIEGTLFRLGKGLVTDNFLIIIFLGYVRRCTRVNVCV